MSHSRRKDLERRVRELELREFYTTAGDVKKIVDVCNRVISNKGSDAGHLAAEMFHDAGSKPERLRQAQAKLAEFLQYASRRGWTI